MRLAHTLKGVAGTLGARALQHSAAELEQASKDSAPEDLEERLAAVAARLKVVLDGISVLEESDSSEDSGDLGSEASPLDPTVTTDLLPRLRLLLEDDDTAALEIIDSLKTHAAGQPWSGRLLPIEGALDAYDFERALVYLEELEAALA